MGAGNGDDGSIRAEMRMADAVIDRGSCAAVGAKSRWKKCLLMVYKL